MIEEGLQQLPPAPSLQQGHFLVFLYVCPTCGWWTGSPGLEETFGSLVRQPGPLSWCEECRREGLVLVKRRDRLDVYPRVSPDGDRV